MIIIELFKTNVRVSIVFYNFMTIIESSYNFITFSTKLSNEKSLDYII